MCVLSYMAGYVRIFPRTMETRSLSRLEEKMTSPPPYACLDPPAPACCPLPPAPARARAASTSDAVSVFEGTKALVGLTSGSREMTRNKEIKAHLTCFQAPISASIEHGRRRRKATVHLRAIARWTHHTRYKRPPERSITSHEPHATTLHSYAVAMRFHDPQGYAVAMLIHACARVPKRWGGAQRHNHAPTARAL